MNTDWKRRFIAGLLLLLLTPGMILIIVAEQPSIRVFIMIAIGYCVGLSLGQKCFARVPTAAPQRQLSLGQTRMIVLIIIGFFVSTDLLVGKQLMGDIVASILSTWCVIVTYLLGHYWHTRPR